MTRPTCKGERAPKESPASLALAIPVLAHGPLAGEGLAACSAECAGMVPLGGTRHENLPVASGPLSLQPQDLSAATPPHGASTPHLLSNDS